MRSETKALQGMEEYVHAEEEETVRQRRVEEEMRRKVVELRKEVEGLRGQLSATMMQSVRLDAMRELKQMLLVNVTQPEDVLVPPAGKSLELVEAEWGKMME